MTGTGIFKTVVSSMGEGILIPVLIVPWDISSMAISGISKVGLVWISILAWLGISFGEFSLTNPDIDVAMTSARLGCSGAGGAS